MRLEELKIQINDTLSRPPLEAETVIGACQTLSQELLAGVHEDMVARAFPGGEEREAVRRKIAEAAWILSREYLEEKLRLELGTVGSCREADSCREPHSGKEDDSRRHPHIRRMPLGVLFHIGAGNMDALPAYSVIEGMLAGNINLLKLPESDKVLSRAILHRLTEIEPALAPYVYVFGFSSADVGKMKRLASLADAVVIWGGDEAVSAVRRLAPPSCRIIAWGHKISFAYVTEAGRRQDSLHHLAAHMLDTEQLLCSSCQGIYLDTEDGDATEQFCRDFSQILESEVKKRLPKDIGTRARNTLRVHNSRLEASAFGGKTVFSGGSTSVTWERQPRLEVSLMFGNCWVKNLKRDAILPVLREDCGYLQTVVLMCGEEEWETLAERFCRAGAVHIRRARDEDFYQAPLPHDGEYPLQRYSRYVVS